jgi:hypothetical protein
MKLRYVTIALGAIATMAVVVSPALGGPSLQQLVKQEVAKQLSSAQTSKKSKRGPRGPAGANGAAGVNGANGAAGLARAYAKVTDHNTTPCAPNCAISHSSGVTSVRRASAGVYCITGPGLSNATSFAVPSVDYGATSTPETALAQGRFTAGACSGSEIEVDTIRNTGTHVDNITFLFVIP